MFSETALVDFIHTWHIVGQVREVVPPTKKITISRRAGQFRQNFEKNGRSLCQLSLIGLEIWYLEYVRYPEHDGHE